MPKSFEDVSHRVRQAAQRQNRSAADGGPRPQAGGPQRRGGGPGRPAALWSPLVNVALAGFAGYVIGCLQARRRR